MRAGPWPTSPFPANPETSGRRWGRSPRRRGAWACRRRIETFTGLTLGENRRVLDLTNAVFAEVGYTLRDGLYDIRMPLRTLKPVASPTQGIPDAA